MYLFTIPSQSVFGKNFAKTLAKAFSKTTNIWIQTGISGLIQLV